jgi:RNA polymerase sigma factor (TIGR02999 family)
MEEHEVTRLLRRWHEGEYGALDRLVPLIYSELKRIAAGCLNGERPTASLQATVLVHEAYLRLADYREPDFESRKHFYVMAAHIMRRFLIDHARRRNAAKRDGTPPRDAFIVPPLDIDVLALDRALHSLALSDPDKARLVELRYFAGLRIPEIAGIMGTSSATVKRQWAVTKTLLYRALCIEPVL